MVQGREIINPLTAVPPPSCNVCMILDFRKGACPDAEGWALDEDSRHGERKSGQAMSCTVASRLDGYAVVSD